MSYVALYRKYRPNNFNDLIGQNAVTSIIKNEILNNKVSHAYIFSGPRGTGKTSAAKIIAKMVNCHNLSPFLLIILIIDFKYMIWYNVND